MSLYDLIFEADERGRALQRAHLSSPGDEETREAYIQHLKRAGDHRGVSEVMASHHANSYRLAHDDHERLKADMAAKRGKWDVDALNDAQVKIDHHEGKLRAAAKRLNRPPGHFLPRRADEPHGDHISHLARISGSVTGGASVKGNRGFASFGHGREADGFINSLKKHYPGSGALRLYGGGGPSSTGVRFRLPNEERSAK